MELPPKLWFKLERIKGALRRALSSSPASPDTGLRMCPHCRGLIDRDASTCPLCGESMRHARARAVATTPGRVLGVIPVPSTATSVIVGVNIALYAVSWYLTQASAGLGAASSMGEVSGQVLFRLGAKFSPAIYAGQEWRLVTAMFLHAGLLHIGLNLWCIFDLAPEVESLFSTTKFVVLYLATGVCGFVLSTLWRPGLSVGASGAIMGMIGILIGASFHHGHLGKEYRGMLWRWVLYIFIFGLLPFFAVDNAAHIGGLLSGLVLGYFVPEGEPFTQSSANIWNTLALLSVLIIAGSFALMALQLNRPLQ
jgi:rhomboid protease GluP